MTGASGSPPCMRIQASISSARVPSAMIAARSITAPPYPSGRQSRMTAARTAPSGRASRELLAGIVPSLVGQAVYSRLNERRLHGPAGSPAAHSSLLHRGAAKPRTPRLPRGLEPVVELVEVGGRGRPALVIDVGEDRLGELVQPVRTLRARSRARDRGGVDGGGRGARDECGLGRALQQLAHELRLPSRQLAQAVDADAGVGGTLEHEREQLDRAPGRLRGGMAAALGQARNVGRRGDFAVAVGCRDDLALHLEGRGHAVTSATRGLWVRTPDQRRSRPAQQANPSAPAVPVAVISTPAAADAATPSLPRIRTAAAAPTAGPTGSWPSVTTAISTAIASKNDASTPTACSSIQLRKIWQKTATRTQPTTRPPPLALRITASPRQSWRPVRNASRRSPAPPATAAAAATIGDHQGSPSG